MFAVEPVGVETSHTLELLLQHLDKATFMLSNNAEHTKVLSKLYEPSSSSQQMKLALIYQNNVTFCKMMHVNTVFSLISDIGMIS